MNAKIVGTGNRPADGGICHQDLRLLTEDAVANRIVSKKQLSDVVTSYEIHAPLIAASAKPGQFVVVRPNDYAERIPLTISKADTEAGTITIIVQEVGRTTKELAALEVEKDVFDVAGPFGIPTEVENFGTVVCVGGGVGVAILKPVTAAMKEAGNEVIGIIGARDQSLIILEDEMRAATDVLHVTTDNGSYGRKGFVSDVLKEILDSGKKVDRVFAIGPLPMMKVISDLTKGYGVKTIVSLDPVMIDGTGMCGGCRVTVDGQTKFTCVDGPDFDAHLVDWDELRSRKRFYADEERAAVENMQGGQK